MRSARCLAAACVLSLFGCGDDLTQLIVVVDTNLVVPGEVDQINLVVDGPTENSVDGSRALDREGLLPLTLGLTPAGGTTGPVTVTATAVKLGVPIVSRTVRARFVPGQTLMLRVSLLRVCTGRAACAGADSTCTDDGSCGSIDVGSGDLPTWTGRPARLPGTPSSMDASVEAGPDATLPDGAPPPIDTGTDSGPLLDGSSRCPSSAICDPAAQTGCSGGQGCDIITSGDLICRPVGSGTDGTPCSNGLDCIVGFGCIGGVGPSACRRLCCAGDDSVCPAGQSCIASIENADPAYQACFPSGCDPVGQTGCAADQQCYPRDDMGNTICVAPAGTGMQGDACSGNVNECARGFVCLEPRCLKQCRVGGGEPSCPGVTRCLAFPGFTTLGLCDS